MASEELEEHPSYHNRYRRSSTDIPPTHHQARRLSSISEIMDGAMDFGNQSVSESHAPKKPLRSQLSRMASGDSTNSDDVFMESGGHPALAQFGKKISLEPTVSSASTASILPNPYNKFNHKIHSVVWCACCFYFVFFCCLPAVRYMDMSDEEHRKGSDILAKKYGRRSTIGFILGTVLSIVMYACVFFLIIYYSTYMASM